MNDFVLLGLLAGAPAVVWTSITISRLAEELHELKKRVLELESEQADEQPDNFRPEIWSMGGTREDAKTDLWNIGVNSPSKVIFLILLSPSETFSNLFPILLVAANLVHPE